MSNVRAIVIHEYGAPDAMVRVEKIELAGLQPDEVRVRMLAAPINPADLNVIEGKYPLRLALPGVPGAEGAGVVEEIGAEVRDVRADDLVLLPHDLGSWRETGVMKAAEVWVVPPGIAPEQAAMLKINPATALRMLRDFESLKSGEWMVQNAANSAVGRAVIQIARATGLRTVNVVRRPELIETLKSEGADAVVVEGEGENLREKISAATAGAPIRLALNAIGGESALHLANALAPGGTIVTYGAMGRQPLRIPNGLLIFQDLRWRGFWITQWYRTAPREAVQVMLDEIFTLAVRGVLRTPIERIYPLEQATQALAHAARGQRSGKILFGAPNSIIAAQPSA